MVARICADNPRPILAIAEQLGVTRGRAQALLDQARAAGLVPPAIKPVVAYATPEAKLGRRLGVPTTAVTAAATAAFGRSFTEQRDTLAEQRIAAGATPRAARRLATLAWPRTCNAPAHRWPA